MLQWDPLGETSVRFAAGSDASLVRASAAIGACTLPLVVRDFRRAAVLGTATLLIAGRRPVLLTAAHVFDSGVRLGNLMVPLPGARGFASLEAACLMRSRSVDIAVIDISRMAGVTELLCGMCAAPLPRARQDRGHRTRTPRHGRAQVMVSGYPAALSRFERGWLAARRFTLLTDRHHETAAIHCPADRLFGYGRVARRPDGLAIHTPALEGMSGAGIWVLEGEADDGKVRLRLDAVQSAYVHGRYLRGHDIGAAAEMLRA